MSWKSIVSASVLCLIASPAFAVPSLQVTNTGLNAQGNWVWNVTATPTAAGTPMAVELGFRDTVAASSIVSADRTEANFDTPNPGTKIFTWETLTDVDPGAGTNMRPVGLQANCTGCTLAAPDAGNVVAGTLDELFAALGSIDFVAGGAQQVLQIVTTGPTEGRLTTNLQLLGAYSGNGRVAELTGAVATNYSNFSGTASRTVVIGDLDLVTPAGGTAVDIADFSTLVGNLNAAGSFTWAQGNVTGASPGAVDIADFSALVGCLNNSGAPCNTTANNGLNINGVAGGAALGSAAVPEPASIALAGLALVGTLGIIRRRRSC